jgi:fimbrial chaperone protein
MSPPEKNRCFALICMLVLALAMLIGIPGGGAGELKLSTVRIDLDDTRSNVALTVTNVGTASSLVQFRVMAWSQEGSQDVLNVTRELIANPPIAEIPAGAEQIVRIGYVGKKQRAKEGSYRLLVEEVPKKDHEQTHAIETYLKLSVPIFVAPLSGADGVALPPAVTMGRDAAGKPALIVRNADSRHLRLTGYRLADASGREGRNHAGLFYVLPDATMTLPLDPADPSAPGRAVLVTDPGAPPLQIDLRP